jgi:hypothetical protein
MKRILILSSLLLVNSLVFCQPVKHSGEGNSNTTLFDSGGVSLSVNETSIKSFMVCEVSTGGTKFNTFKCEFIFKNTNPYPVSLSGYSFHTKNTQLFSGSCSEAKVFENLQAGKDIIPPLPANSGRSIISQSLINI